jgi:hypothetical protein
MPCTSLLSHSEMKQYFKERENDPDFNSKKKKKTMKVPKMKSLDSPATKKETKPIKKQDDANTLENKENIAPQSTVSSEPRATRSKQLKIKNQGRPKRKARELSERTISLGDFEEIRELA